MSASFETYPGPSLAVMDLRATPTLADKTFRLVVGLVNWAGTGIKNHPVTEILAQLPHFAMNLVGVMSRL